MTKRKWLVGLLMLLCLADLPAMAGASIIELLNKGWSSTSLASYEEALKAGADPNEKNSAGKTALILAIWSNRPGAAELLLKYGADANLPAPSGDTALMLAVRKQNIAEVKQLLNAGADPNARNDSGNSVLDCASSHSDLGIIDLLVEKGAHNHFVGSEVDLAGKDEKGTPLLIQAILAKASAYVEYLLRKGADPNVRDAEGSTPLIRAFYTYSSVVPVLIKYGADVRLADNWCRTPLHVAAKNDSSSMLALLEAGADIEAVASGSYTPLMYAFSGAYPDNAAILLEHGANIKVRRLYGSKAAALCLSDQESC